MKKFLLSIAVATLFQTIVIAPKKSVIDYTQYVNPFIGTGSIDSLSLSGSNVPGAVVPQNYIEW